MPTPAAAAAEKRPEPAPVAPKPVSEHVHEFRCGMSVAWMRDRAGLGEKMALDLTCACGERARVELTPLV